MNDQRIEWCRNELHAFPDVTVASPVNNAALCLNSWTSHIIH